MIETKKKFNSKIYCLDTKILPKTLDLTKKESKIFRDKF